MQEINFAELSQVGIWDIAFTSELQAIRFSQHYGLIMADPICNSHKHHQIPMKLVLDSNPLGERYRFRCGKKNCRREIPLRKNNYFQFSHLPISKLIKFMYVWA